MGLEYGDPEWLPPRFRAGDAPPDEGLDGGATPRRRICTGGVLCLSCPPRRGGVPMTQSSGPTALRFWRARLPIFSGRASCILSDHKPANDAIAIIRSESRVVSKCAAHFETTSIFPELLLIRALAGRANCDSEAKMNPNGPHAPGISRFLVMW
jgi:hypothetical protein